jgi:hypothetical protein
MCYRLGCSGDIDCHFDRIWGEFTPARRRAFAFQPPRGSDPRFIGGASSVKPTPPAKPATPVTSKATEMLDAQLKAAKETVAQLERARAEARHQERGQQILLTCPDGSRHKWKCTQYRRDADYTGGFPIVRNTGNFVCHCGAKAYIA